MTRGYDSQRLTENLTPCPRGSTFYRLIPARHRATPLGVSAYESRFSPPAAEIAADPENVFRVAYLSESVACCFCETLIRDRFARRQKRWLPARVLEDYWVVEVHVESPLALLDLRGDGPLRVGAPAAVTHNTDHRAARKLSAALHESVPHAAGISYDSRYTQAQCVAVYDRALSALSVKVVLPLYRFPVVYVACERYDIQLVTMSR